MISLLASLALLTTLQHVAIAQLTTIRGTGTAALTGDNVIPTGPQVTYLTYASTITLAAGSSANGTSQVTRLTGGISSKASNATTTTSTKTTSSVAAVNTQPCNNYVEFCSRKYSNITEVAAHNFAFVKKGNLAANQEYGVIDQLNDGVRMLQAQTHYANGTVFFCHTSCSLLNAGTVLSIFTKIAGWLDDHPFDVVSILIGNGDFINVKNYTSSIQESGLGKYVYTPPVVPMNLAAWPTLGEMILRQKRLVVFMDYNANQTEVPYILDEFSQLWETPFSPTDTAFPCTQQRPPNLSDEDAAQRLYMANHNLNVQATLLGSTLLVPNTADLNQTNAVGGYTSLGAMSGNCTEDWGRPPNFLLVDYYDRGSSPGSVFEVAALANKVKYNRKCCGGTTSGALKVTYDNGFVLALVVSIAALLII